MKSAAVMIFSLLLVPVSLGLAVEQDVKGSRDHQLLSRMPNFSITGYKDTEFDSHSFIGEDKKPVSIEGHKYYIEYHLNKGAAEPGELKNTQEHSGRSEGNWRSCTCLLNPPYRSYENA